MSSTTGIGVPQQLQTPTFDEASGVASRIQGQIGNIQNLFAEVQSLLHEFDALTAPDVPQRKKGETDEAWNGRMQKYQQDLSKFQSEVAKLNGRIETCYRKLGQAQAILRRMQTDDMPAAERRDADKLKKAVENATESMNAAAKSLGASKADNDGTSSSKEDARIELRITEKNIDIRLSSDPSFKEVIKAFAIMATLVGDALGQAQKTAVTVKMPPTPASGLPPVGLP